MKSKRKSKKKPKKLLKMNRRIEHYRLHAEKKRRKTAAKHRVTALLTRLITLTLEKAPILNPERRWRYFNGLATALLSRREGSRKKLKHLLAGLPKRVSKVHSIELLIKYRRFVLLEAAR
jgi:hypothetical protein